MLIDGTMTNDLKRFYFANFGMLKDNLFKYKKYLISLDQSCELGNDGLRRLKFLNVYWNKDA